MSDTDINTLIAMAKDLRDYHGLDIVTGNERLARCWGGSSAWWTTIADKRPKRPAHDSIMGSTDRGYSSGFRIARCHTN